MEILSCDLETTTNPDHVWEWAIGSYNIYTDEFQWGTTFEWFFEYLESLGNCKVYFHNLKFDGGFKLDYLFREGYEFTLSKKLEVGQFNTLISDKNMFYCIKLKLSKTCTVTFLDSLKVIPMKVSKVAKAFGLPYSKGEIDYDKERPIGYEPTEEEVDYLYRDCKIVGMAMKQMLAQGLDRMTQGSNALHNFKATLPQKFEKIFPEIDCHEEIRPSYKGGFTYASPLYQGLNVGRGKVYDKNSMYPSMMKYKLMPYGIPKEYEGEYVPDKMYPLYIQQIEVIFELKEKHIPTIQIKSGYGNFIPTEYVRGTNDEEITLTLTSIDLELLKDQYDIIHIEYIKGWKFKGTTGLFDKYIDYWYGEKEKATRIGNQGLRTIAKLMLNALYGKFATSTTVQSKIPYYDEKEKKVKYKLGEKETRPPVYLPVACFITAYARDDVVRNAQANFDRFAYADTDSLHLVGDATPEGMDIDPYRIGAWSLESVFYRARFLRAKCYIEEHPASLPKCKVPKSRGRILHIKKPLSPTLHTKGKLQVTCAGMPYSCHKGVTWENFGFGTEYEGKLQHKTVRGGVVLIPTTYKIKVA